MTFLKIIILSSIVIRSIFRRGHYDSSPGRGFGYGSDRLFGMLQGTTPTGVGGGGGIGGGGGGGGIVEPPKNTTQNGLHDGLMHAAHIGASNGKTEGDPLTDKILLSTS